MLLGIFLKVCQAYHSHLRTLTSLPGRAAATGRQHRTEKSNMLQIEPLHHPQGPTGKLSTENVELQHPEDPFTEAVLTQRDLDSYVFPGLTTARRTLLSFACFVFVTQLVSPETLSRRRQTQFLAKVIHVHTPLTLHKEKPSGDAAPRIDTGRSKGEIKAARDLHARASRQSEGSSFPLGHKTRGSVLPRCLCAHQNQAFVQPL